MKRRDFLAITATGTAAMLIHPRSMMAKYRRTNRPNIPRWRGFNITELTGGRRNPFRESDFIWMKEWGLDFARIPMSYWAWSSPEAWMDIDEDGLKLVDEAVHFGREHGIHVNLNFHRIPGYCVNQRELEPHLMFDSPAEEYEKAMVAAIHHWQVFADRYKGIPNEEVSFDLLNEPPWMTDQTRYVDMVHRITAAIREIDPDRLIVADGADIGQTPVPGIVDLGLPQSTRGYLPKMVSHYTATWVPENEFESFDEPTWPMTDNSGKLWNRETLRRELIDPWRPLVDQGVAVHVGEWGCYNKTPHKVALAWMTDLLALWKEMDWGWAMWNLRGSFGVVDSGRQDVDYEDFHGHKLDRKMLDMLIADGK
jgi:endoglucanase